MKKLLLFLSFLIFIPVNAYTQFIYGTIEIEGGITRYYDVYLPQNFHENMPVILTLHSYGDSKEMIKNYTMIHELGDIAGFITAYPAAKDSKWNTGNVASATEDDVEFITALISRLKTDYDIDLNRVYCCGFGQGGAMSYKLAGELSHRITAVASVEGLMCQAMLPTFNPIRSVPILHIHGTEDSNEPWDGTESGLFLLSVEEIMDIWIDNNSCSPSTTTVSLPDTDTGDGCTVEKISYNNNDNDTTVILYKINGGGHNWPGSSLDYSWEGNETGDFNANKEIWNFFKQYDLVTEIDDSEKEGIMPVFNLSQNYPNPFNPATTIKYSIPKQSFVSLKVYDILGREVATLVNEAKPAGNYVVEFNTQQTTNYKQLSSGVYIYRIRAGSFNQVRKMLLVK
ncbi:MAG: T9SS type A sorting domain-containing protein [Ignavibacteriaceae bacterium]